MTGPERRPPEWKMQEDGTCIRIPPKPTDTSSDILTQPFWGYQFTWRSVVFFWLIVDAIMIAIFLKVIGLL